METILLELLQGFQVIFTPAGFGFLMLGVIAGIAFGATPGISPSTGVALLVPFSYSMPPAVAFVFFVAAYQAANYGGSITAISINAPGTPAAIVTAIDGYELTKQGKPGLALGTAVIASALGGFIGALILILLARPLAGLGLLFGPAEYFSLTLFALTTVIGFSTKNRLKTCTAILLGLLLATIGTDPFSGNLRFTLGLSGLYDGVPLIPAMIGLFALAEIFSQIESNLELKKISTFSGKLPGVNTLLKLKWAILRSSVLGTLIGIIPGAGATIASFISYGEARRFSKKKELFGRGSLEGITSSEAANSSSVGGALVPLLSLGIPGSATDAVLLGAFSLHGLTAGPELFKSSPEIVYGIFSALLAANLLILVFGLAGNALWLKLISIPQGLLYPLVIVLCITGSYTVNGTFFDSGLCLAFGVFGWLLKRNGYPLAPLVMALVLGSMLEMNLRRVLLMGGIKLLFVKPISAVLLTVALLAVALPLIRKKPYLTP
ncbi:MAG: C4-dicarboxylate ABC transporter permease [Candidatus Dadabacteria bacterium]|nr:MAG: C4-dicarboxylate ABC transporter permease [Candidatus Dadabacteria bacterium]